MGAGFGVSGRRRGVRIVVINEAKVSKAARRSGAGAKFMLGDIAQEVKLWHEAERRMGHQVDKVDVFNELKDRLQYHITAEGNKDEAQNAKKLERWREYLEKLEKLSLKDQRQRADRLCKRMCVKLLAPQRYSQLTPGEEKVRCELTWQQFDERLWIAAAADAKELSCWVADPADFINKRSETWLVFSDQIPFWVKIGFMKVLYAEFELEQMSQKRFKRERQIQQSSRVR